MDTLAMQFGVIPYLVEVLLNEKSETVSRLYDNMTNSEKQYLFDRKNVPLNRVSRLETSLKRKLERIRKKHDKRRKTSNIMHSCV